MLSLYIPGAGILLFLIMSCSGASELPAIDIPAGGDSAYQWSQLKVDHINEDFPIVVFEYRAIFDSMVKPFYADSFSSYGIIIPRSGVVASGRESIMRFGNDSMFGAVSYKYIHMYEESNSSSILGDILFPPSVYNNSWEPHNAKTIMPIGVVLEGIFRSKTFASFYFDHFRKSEFTNDSSETSGYLVYGTDTLVARTSYNPTPLFATNGKRWNLRQGYSLSRGDTVVAFLQHPPYPASKYDPPPRKTLYLSKSFSPELKMVVSGYFGIVSRVLKLAYMDSFY
jgi:hypothetical protein